jgi:hypothetical protein
MKSFHKELRNELLYNAFRDVFGYYTSNMEIYMPLRGQFRNIIGVQLVTLITKMERDTSIRKKRRTRFI